MKTKLSYLKFGLNLKLKKRSTLSKKLKRFGAAIEGVINAKNIAKVMILLYFTLMNALKNTYFCNRNTKHAQQYLKEVSEETYSMISTP